MRTTKLPEFTTNAWLRFDAIRRGIAIARPRTVLEIGAGEGAFAAWIAPRVDYLGIEHDDRSRAMAQTRLVRAGGGGRLVPSLDDVTATDFDVVCAFEVLEHIEDDARALAEWRARLRPGGHLLLSVPARAHRYGPFDEMVGHFRRYERDELRTRLAEVGLSTVRWTCHGAGLGQVLEAGRNLVARRRAPAAAATTAAERTAASGRLLQPHSTVGVVACAALATPFRVIQAPFAGTDCGTGYVVVARSAQ